MIMLIYIVTYDCYIWQIYIFTYKKIRKLGFFSIYLIAEIQKNIYVAKKHSGKDRAIIFENTSSYNYI